MTLENLLSIRRLQVFEPTPEGIQRLLASATRNLSDASLADLSSENRFDAAYKTIMQCSMVGLWANGYRTSTSQPGHHQTAIQSLTKTMGVEPDVIIVLDALRRQRNLNDYEGDPISEATVTACIDEASALLQHTEKWLSENRPDLMP